jgi:hypothetical protein
MMGRLDENITLNLIYDPRKLAEKPEKPSRKEEMRWDKKEGKKLGRKNEIFTSSSSS